MGQQICAIITEKNIQIGKDIVHFVEDNYTVIPINLGISFFIDNIKNFSSIDKYCTFLKTTDEYVNEKVENEDNDDDEEEEESHTLKSLIEIIETYKLNNFIIEYYSEWADTVEDNLCIAIINGEIKKQSIYRMWKENNNDNINIEEFYKLIGAERNWIANESRYFNYSRAKFIYNKK
jgi:transcription elongation factor Elf1